MGFVGSMKKKFSSENSPKMVGGLLNIFQANQKNASDNGTYVEGNQFMISFGRTGVTRMDIRREETYTYRENRDVFAYDSKGWFYLCKSLIPGSPTWINGRLATAGEKYYLVNGDLIVLQDLIPDKTQMFLYSILNQKETSWNCSFVSDWHNSDFLSQVIKEEEEGVLQYKSAEENPIFLYHDLYNNEPVGPFQCMIADERHLITDGFRVYYQDSLKEEEKQILPLASHTLPKGESLDIMIRERLGNKQDGVARKLLKDIELSIDGGQMVLVLGGAGAGKTTFFNAVMGMEKADATIKLGKYDVYREYAQVKDLIGFVPQRDDLRDNDTVYMTLKDAARNGLPREVKADNRLMELRIIQVLTMLDMLKEKDNLVSKLSGGQRKKLNIAIRYIVDPTIFFLDEPDSGVDDYQASKMMYNLREIADHGKIVMVITHSPDRIRDLYDKVIVLAKDSVENCGTLAFFGSPDEAFDYFGVDSLNKIVGCIQENPDVYIEKYKNYRKADV